jgi:hypothetical protein
MSHRVPVIISVAALGLFAGIGIWAAITTLPAICAPPPDLYLHRGHGSKTWIGQGVEAAYGLSFLLLIAVYVGKRWITRMGSSRATAALLYVLGMACSLPYIWFFVVLDWHNPFVYRVSCWVYYPIAIWAVPTSSFAWDMTSRVPFSLQGYVARSLIELLMIIPAWVVSWMFVSFFLLGGGWI